RIGSGSWKSLTASRIAADSGNKKPTGNEPVGGVKAWKLLNAELVQKDRPAPFHEEKGADEQAGDDGQPQQETGEAAGAKIHVMQPAPAQPALFLLFNLLVDRLELLSLPISPVGRVLGLGKVYEFGVGGQGAEGPAACPADGRLRIHRLVL